MNFWNVKIGAKTYNVLAADKVTAIIDAEKMYRQEHHLPKGMSLVHLYGGTEQVQFKPGDKVPVCR